MVVLAGDASGVDVAGRPLFRADRTVSWPWQRAAASGPGWWHAVTGTDGSGGDARPAVRITGNDGTTQTIKVRRVEEAPSDPYEARSAAAEPTLAGFPHVTDPGAAVGGPDRAAAARRARQR